MQVPATRLAEERIARGITQRDLARMLGVSPATLSSIENAWRAPWPKLRADCARILGIPEAKLFPPNEAVRR